MLSHPLVTNLLSWKWDVFGGYLYYAKLILYCIFLFFLSGYILHTAPMRQPFRNENCQLDDAELKDSLLNIVFVKIGRVIILGLAIIHLVLEVSAILFLFLIY